MLSTILLNQMQKKEYSVEIGGKILTAIFTDLAEQAHGSVMLKCGETVVLATTCMSKDKQPGLGFFNLTVDYVERFYASGKISGSRFVKREGKPSEDAILASRVIDRTLRPLFDQSMRHAVQVIVTVLSVEEENDPVVLAVNAASLALSVSNIPWVGSIGAVRIGKYDNDDLKINVSTKLRENDAQYKFDLIVCGKEENINMIEASAHQNSEDELENTLTRASQEITKLENFQKNIVKEIGKEKRIIVKDNYKEREDFALEDHLFDETENKILHEKAINENKRADGRKMDELRDLYAQAGGVSSVLHGSGIFYRGGTHVLSVLTLGGPEDRHMIDGMQTKAEKRFMHHYNFPPYSSGET